MNLQELFNIMPLLLITLSSLLVLILIAFEKSNKDLIFYTSLAATAVTGIYSAFTIDYISLNFQESIYSGGITNLFYVLFSLIGFLVILSSKKYIQRLKFNFSEYYVLILFAVTGMMVMAASRNLIVTFLGLEIMSIAFYILAGFNRKNKLSNEAGVKYFLLGAFTSGILLYGIALIYGATRTTNIIIITKFFNGFTENPIFLAGLFLFIIGLSFKISAVPFHMWAPDVYEGSPTTSSALMATGGKAAAFIAFMATLVGSTGAEMQFHKISVIISLIAAASMIFGSVVALAQTSVKRMLAYSGIANAGYMLIGLAAATKTGYHGITFYIIIYALLNIGAFVFVSVFEKSAERVITINDLAGLGKNNMYLASIMSVFMFALAGIPPFASFFGKYYLFAAALEKNLIWLALAGILSSIIAVYIYLRIILIMFFKNPDEDQEIIEPIVSNFDNTVFIITALLAIQFGLMPQLLMDIISKFF